MNPEMIALLLLSAGKAEFREVPHLAERKRLTRGHLEFRLRLNVPPAQGRSQDWHYSVWFDGDRYRCDRKPFAKEGPREIYGRNCYRPGFDVYYDHDKPNRNMVPLIVHKAVQGKVRPGFILRINPLMFGISAISFPAHREFEIDDIPGADAREILERKTENGKEYVKYRLKHGTIIQEVTSYPKKVPFLESCSFEEVYSDDFRERKVMKALPGEYGKVVFPKKVVNLYEKNGILQEELIIEVLQADFERPIPPRVFTLAGMDIPPGTPVDLSIVGTIGYSQVWDGKNIVRDPGVPQSRLDTEDLEPESSARTYRNLAILFGTSSTVLLGIWFHRRRQVANLP